MIWHCSRKYYKDKSCDSPVIREEDIREKFVSAFNEIYDERDFILECCRALLERLDDTGPIDEQIEGHIRESEIIAEMNRKLLEENSYTVLDQEEFMKKYNAYVKRYDAETSKVEKLQKLRNERKERADKLSAFMFEIHEQDVMIDALMKSYG